MKFRFNSKLYIPFIIAVVVYLFSYQLPKYLVSLDRLHCLQTYIDTLIPFYSPAIVIYIGAFFQWANVIFIALGQSKEKGYRYASAIIMGSLIGLIIYFVYPTCVSRPDVVGTNIFDLFCKFIFMFDNVINACPSFHCFCSTIVLFIIYDSKNTKKSTFIINIIFSILVFISTLLTKQHVFVDVIGGVLLAIVSFILSKKIVFTEIFDKLNEKYKM